MRSWALRMHASYEGANNKVTSTRVEQQLDGEWRPLALSVDSPGFLIFVYSLLTCQHLYMHVNAAERGLVLSEATGQLDLTSSQDWMLADLRVRFDARLRSGTPTAALIAEIEGRMNQCPVSRNIHTSGVHESRLVLG